MREKGAGVGQSLRTGGCTAGCLVLSNIQHDCLTAIRSMVYPFMYLSCTTFPCFCWVFSTTKHPAVPAEHSGHSWMWARFACFCCFLWWLLEVECCGCFFWLLSGVGYIILQSWGGARIAIRDVAHSVPFVVALISKWAQNNPWHCVNAYQIMPLWRIMNVMLFRMIIFTK